MALRRSLLLLLALLSAQQIRAEEETSTTSSLPSAATTLGTLFRQARSEHYYAPGRYGGAGEDSLAAARADPLLEHRDASYYESRCITCDPSKAAQTAAVQTASADRDPYAARWRQRGKYDYYDEDYEDRRYRDRNDFYERVRSPSYDYDRYDPYARNEAYRAPMYNERYDPYERDRYYPRPADRPGDRPLIDRPLLDRPLMERPMERPGDRGYDRGYDRSYERGNGYDNLDQRGYPYDDRYDRYGPGRRPPAPPPTPYDEYGPRYDRFNGNRNYGRHDSRYDRFDGRYDPYERNGYRRPTYDDRYDRFGGGRYPPDQRTYYGVNTQDAGGWPASAGADRPAYASAWNYAGGSRDGWRGDGSNRERERERERDRDAGFYRPRDYFYDSTAAPGGSRGTSYLYDRPESSTKPEADRDKPTNSPQTQESGKTYKD